MSDRYEGGFIKAVPDTTDDYNAPGVWTLEQALAKQKAGVWPPSRDPYFNQTTLLLHGNGADLANNNIFLDSSSNTFPITRNGNTTQGTFSPFSAPDGRWSNYFDGVSGTYLNTPSTGQFAPTGDFTIAWWYYPVVFQTSVMIANYTLSTNTTDWSFETDSTGDLNIYLNGGTLRITGSAVLNLNQWNYIVVSRSGSTVTAYCNGSSVGTYDFGTGTFGSAAKRIRIGAGSAGTNNAEGYISNVYLLDGTALDGTIPTTPFTDGTGVSLLTCQSNRFVDNATPPNAITVNGTIKVTPFSPFAPTDVYDASVNGGSGYFDGTGDNLSGIGTTSDFNFIHNTSGLCTIECWVYWTGVAGTTDVILANRRNSSEIGVALGYNSGGKWIFEIAKGSTGNLVVQALTTADAVANQWVYLCVEWDYVSDSGTWYINGAVDSTFSRLNTATNNNATDSLYIGRNRSDTNLMWQGYISNLRISNSIVYGGAFTPSTEPLTTTSQSATNVELLLNFTNAGIFDNTGKNNLETVDNAQIDTTIKKYGTGSMEFDGTGDWLLVPSSPQFAMGTGNWTVECWAYPSSASTRGLFQITTGHLNSVDTGIGVGVSSNAGNPWRVYHGTTQADTGTNVTTSAWQHIAFVRNGSTVTLYLDGTSIYSATDSSDLNSYTFLTIGAWYSSSFPWIGFIDDLRITKGVARYTANFTPPTGQLLSR